jgi:tripartite-type tricarboxylate transporter receptor subunit TctC
VKSNPGKLNYASQGPGTTSHLTAELFNKVAGTKLEHVPYRGTAPALNDLVAGHVDLIFMQLESAIKLHDGGKARILAVTTEKRIAMLPNIPTMAEIGLKDFISDTWNAITAPPKTPAPVIARLNTALNDALKLPEMQEQYKRLGLQPGGGTPQHLGDIIKADTKRWGDVIREAKIPQI